MKKILKKIFRIIYIYAKPITIAIIVSICATAIFTEGIKFSSERASFLGGAIAGIVGFWSAFLITEQNKELDYEKGQKNILELIKYIILSIDRDFKNIEDNIKNQNKAYDFRKYTTINEEYRDEIEKYKIPEEILGNMILYNYIYDDGWQKDLSYITNFEDKKKIIDFMLYIESCVGVHDGVDTLDLYKEVMKIIKVIEKYKKFKVYDKRFENFAYNCSFNDKVSYINLIKLKILSYKRDDILLKRRVLELDKRLLENREKELERLEKELEI